MRKHTVTVLWGILLLARQATADTKIPSTLYNPIRVDVGISGAWQPATSKGGIGGWVEPKFALMDNVNVGLRFDGDALFGGSFGSDGSVSVGLAATESFLLKGEYLLGTGGVRPFVSLGIGGYDIAGEDVNASGSSTQVHQKAGVYFGIAPEIGFDLGRVRIAAVYNVILGASEEVTQDVSTGGPPTTDNRPLHYVTFEFGVRFGGGKKGSNL